MHYHVIVVPILFSCYLLSIYTHFIDKLGRPMVAPIRETYRLNQKPVFNLMQAYHAAEKIGLPLNYWVTINLWQTDHARDTEVQIFQKLRNLYFTKWATRPRKAVCEKLGWPYPYHGLCAHAWTFENSADVPVLDDLEDNKVHVHWLVHVPKERVNEFWELLPVWLEKSGAVPPEDDGYRDIRDIENQKVLYYCTKDADRAFAENYHIHRLGNYGRVVGRRSGYSRSIGPTVVRALIKSGKYRPGFKKRRFLAPRIPD